MNSIYTNADPRLLKLFEQAGSLQKVLCAPLDFAKKSHAVLFCNGAGDVLKKVFHVPNSAAGAQELVAQLKATCRHRAIDLKHAVVGGEDLPTYAENFLAALRRAGLLVARVNAFAARQQRDKQLASTDALDLHGIAHCLLKGRARALEDGQELHERLRLLCRERDYLVGSLTGLKNRLHGHVDRLFPGFFEKGGLKPFGPASLWLLRRRFSGPQVARRSLSTLAEGLGKCRVKHPLEKAAALQELAAQALPPRAELVGESQLAVETLVELLEMFSRCAGELQGQIAELLAQSPGARLTSVPGLGVTLSAGLAGEIFLLREIPPLARLCCYAGIVPATAQTGGPEKAATHYARSGHSNLRLKNYLMRAGEAMARQPNSDAARLRQQAEQKGQHVQRVLAKHAAGVVRALLLNERAYLPQTLYAPTSAQEERGFYLAGHWPGLCQKWRPLLSLNRVFDPALPLGRWRQAARDSYGISLPLPGSDEASQQSEEVLGAIEHESSLEESA
jgi:transposase